MIVKILGITVFGMLIVINLSAIFGLNSDNQVTSSGGICGAKAKIKC